MAPYGPAAPGFRTLQKKTTHNDFRTGLPIQPVAERGETRPATEPASDSDTRTGRDRTCPPFPATSAQKEVSGSVLAVAAGLAGPSCGRAAFRLEIVMSRRRKLN